MHSTEASAFVIKLCIHISLITPPVTPRVLDLPGTIWSCHCSHDILATVPVSPLILTLLSTSIGILLILSSTLRDFSFLDIRLVPRSVANQCHIMIVLLNITIRCRFEWTPWLISLWNDSWCISIEFNSNIDTQTQRSPLEHSPDWPSIWLRLPPVLDFNSYLFFIVFTSSLGPRYPRVILAVVIIPHGSILPQKVPSPVWSASQTAIVPQIWAVPVVFLSILPGCK